MTPSTLEFAVKYDFNSLFRFGIVPFIIASHGCLGIVPSTKMLLDNTPHKQSTLIKCFPPHYAYLSD